MTGDRPQLGARGLAVVIAACCAPWALAQTELRPVDAGTARSGVMAGPGRSAPTDLRAPSAFDRVYRVMNGGKDTGSLARQQGGIVATFSASQNTGAAGIPAGTIFHIGTPRDLGSRPRAAADFRAPRSAAIPTNGARDMSGSAVNTSARDSMRVAAPPTPARDPGAPPIPLSIFSDETYRVRMITTLLDRALAAPKG